MANEEKDSPLEGLKDRLYVRGGVERETVPHSNLLNSNQVVRRDWNELKEKPAPARALSMSFFVKLFIFSLIFFIVALGVAVFFFYRGSVFVSSRNVDLAISGPAEIKAGEEIFFQVAVINRNNTDLEFAELVMEYPAGARTADSRQSELKRSRLNLGTIKKGETKLQTVTAVIFGEKDTELEWRFAIEYRLADSNAIYDKVFNQRLKITDAPISLTLDLPSEVNANQEVNLNVTVASNAAETLNDLLLTIIYPPGFMFKEATPPPIGGRDTWRIGDLGPQDRRSIKITGLLEGQNEELKSFRLAVGRPDKDNERAVGLAYSTIFKTLTIKKTQVDLDFSINGDFSPEFVADPNEELRVDINWINNLPVAVTAAEISMKLSGELFDRTRVSPSGGFYQSLDNTIVWNKLTQPTLNLLPPGEKGRVSFDLNVLPLSSFRGVLPQNPVINLDLLFRGRKTDDESAKEPIETKLSKQIKINSVIQLSANVLYRSGVLQNRGPLPPRIGEETTYTVVWSVVNSFNEVKDVMVKATLPAYVKWLGAVSPSEEKVEFDAGDGEVRWALGRVSAGQGFANQPREVAFQVAITPSLSQVRESPVLVSKPELEGVDAFTGARLTSSKNSLTTATADPDFRYSDGQVVGP